jgi:hypothetical protein
MRGTDLVWTEQVERKQRTWGAEMETISMAVVETKNKVPFDVYVMGVQVGFKRTLEAAKACAIRQANLRLEAEENTK